MPPTIMRRSLLRSLGALAVAGAAQAQTPAYPDRPVRLVVPFTPGGSTDLLGRLLADRAARELGQSVVPENRPGAGGTIGAAMVAGAPPDGYTVLIVDTGAVAISPSVPPGVSYAPLRDFEPITQLVNSTTVLVARPDLPARTVPDLVTLARASPGALSYGAVGQNSSTHLSAMAFERMAGVSLLHVPYQGASPAITDLLGGRIDLAFVGAAGAVPHILAGRLRGLAVTTPGPAPGLPEVPPMASMLPGYDTAGWFCLLAPRGTPGLAVERLHHAFTTAVKAPEIQDTLSRNGFEAVGSSPNELAAKLRSDIGRYAEILRTARR